MAFNQPARAEQGVVFGPFDIHFDDVGAEAGQGIIQGHDLNHRVAIFRSATG